MPRWIEGHCEDCPECAAYLQSQRSLINRLQTELPAERLPSPPFLHGKIMASLDRLEESPTPAGHPGSLWASGLAVLALLAICLGVLRFQSPVIESQPPVPVIAGLPTFTEDLKQRWALLEEFNRDLEMPLDVEMQNTVADARNAIQLLASNFLPEKYQQSIRLAAQ